MVGARPGAECRVIRVRSWREYVWAAIGECVRFDAGMCAWRSCVVVTAWVWMVVDETAIIGNKGGKCVSE